MNEKQELKLELVGMAIRAGTPMENVVGLVSPILKWILDSDQPATDGEQPSTDSDQPADDFMQPFQARVIREKQELDARLAKLVAFLDSPIFRELPMEEKYRLSCQQTHMTRYSNVLADRIEAFFPPRETNE